MAVLNSVEQANYRLVRTAVRTLARLHIPDDSEDGGPLTGAAWCKVSEIFSISTSDACDLCREHEVDPYYDPASLLYCPFCGGKARLVNDPGAGVIVGCDSTECELQPKVVDSDRITATERWNRRPGT